MNDSGDDLARAKDEALEGLRGDSTGERYERMAVEASWDDHVVDRRSGGVPRSQLIAEASARAADAKFGTNIASNFTETTTDASASSYFYDTEFHWDGTRISLISIAVVSGDGREFYAHADQYVPDVAARDPFLAQHVLPAVVGMPRRTMAELRAGLESFFDPRPRQLWADFGAWDQVALMQIWGPMVDQPAWLPAQTRDVRLFASLLNRALPNYPDGRHDALIDARHVRRMVNEIAPDLRRVAQICRVWK